MIAVTTHLTRIVYGLGQTHLKNISVMTEIVTFFHSPTCSDPAPACSIQAIDSQKDAYFVWRAASSPRIYRKMFISI